jgi:hypothetical protein
MKKCGTDGQIYKINKGTGRKGGEDKKIGMTDK